MEERPHYGVVNFERRKYPRFSIDLPIEYYRDQPEERHQGRAINASEGGLLIYLPERVNIGECLRIKLFFASGRKLNTIEMVAQVAWTDIHLGEEWGELRTGVRFIDIPSEELNKMKEFLKGLSE